MRITGRGVMVAVLLALVLPTAACGRPGSPGSSTPSPESPPAWVNGEAPSEVVAIRESADQRDLTIDLKMPAGLADHACWRNLAGSVTDFSDASALIGIVADMWTDPRCGKTTIASVTVALPAPLGKRTVNVNSSSLGDYIADAAGGTTLHYCYNFQCGPLPPASCEAESVRAAVLGTDIDRHAHSHVLSCDSQWLIIDFASTGGPACDNTCPTSNATTIRWFYRASDHGWQAVFATHREGCAPIQAAEPSFPAALCAVLGPG